MKVGAPFACAAILVPLVWAAPAADVEEIRFAPTEGLALVRTFETAASNDTESTTDHGSSTSSSDLARRLVVTDEVGEVEDGRILALERTFDAIGSETRNEMTFGDQTQQVETSATCDVEGETVTFEWDPDEEEYVAESDGVDEDVLEELHFDYDFTVLLPDDAVEEGDEWTLTPDDYRTLMDPWAGLPWQYERDGEAIDMDGAPEPDIEEEDDGEIVVTFAGTRDEDGVTVAVLTLEGEIETERTLELEHEFAQGTSTEYSESTESRSIEGEALWNLDAGHLHSLTIEVDLSSEGTTISTAIFNDQEMEMEVDISRTGTIRFSAELEAAE